MNLWKLKLAAYLHDPPSKCLDIRTHGERSDAAFRQAGFVDSEVGEYFAHADHTGAAADRLPFPKSGAASLQCAFDGVRNAFRHPLSGQPLPFPTEFRSVEQGFEGEQSVQPALSSRSLDGFADEDERWRARFFAHWRLWSRNAASKDHRLALLPADTRIPDHTIWTHMQVVSALAGCVNRDKVWRPAFLKFQLGPVQDFIAAARSTRDLWSGSYLLSWLMAAGMKALSAEIGPDAVIFPNLKEQPLFDLHWRGDLWNRAQIGSDPVWESLGWENTELLTPNLPNVFLAVVPADRGAELGRLVESAIQKEWQRIADSVWRACESAGLTADESSVASTTRRARFDRQVQQFLSLSWCATPWPEDLKGAIELAKSFADRTPVKTAAERVKAVVRMAEESMPINHRDGRFYVGGADGPKDKLNNVGLGWAVILAVNSWQLDAVRQTRAFSAITSGGWQVGTSNSKDALTGREESVAGGSEWVERARSAGNPWANLFKKNDWLGAPTLIKRVWHHAYLRRDPWNLATGSDKFPMPNTRGVAGHEPFSDGGDDETAEAASAEEKYFAVIAFDGDEIGKWVSGEKTPTFASQLADYTDGGGNPTGAVEYFRRESDPDDRGSLGGRYASFLDSHRPLSPSYHLQFSESLGNFALHCARPIVEAFDGRLIYAGGDDVVAMVPADTALACAEALQMAFRGDPGIARFIQKHAVVLRSRHECIGRRVPYFQNLACEGSLLDSPAAGFLVRLDRVDQNHQPIPFPVPGPKADASVGIAIAHFKAPLQDIVRAAQAAEKRAKRKPNAGGLDRSAVAVTLMKRSGEITEWGSKWEGGLGLYRALAEALEQNQLSAKFPHRLAELLGAYVTDSTGLIRDSQSLQPVNGFPAAEVIRREFGHCIQRQRGKSFPKDSAEADLLRNHLIGALNHYLHSLETVHGSDAEAPLRALIGLCQTVAFAHRTASQPTTPPTGTP